jgi:hypothetical protein
MDEDIRKMFEDHERRISALEGAKAPELKSESGSTRGQSINEYLLETKAESYIEKTVACGYYLERERSMEYFAVEDIEQIMRTAREPISKNISKDIQRGMKKGWIMEHTEKKAGKRTYRITSKGIEAVNNKFAEKGENDEA